MLNSTHQWNPTPLNHPSQNLSPKFPRYIDHFEDQNKLYLVQEYIQGDTLFDVIQNGTLSENQIYVFLIQLLVTLEFLHNNQYIHRDIKPENIIFSNGNYVLIDFGAIKEVINAIRNPGTRIGTQGYAPIEQMGGRPNLSIKIFNVD